MTSTQLVAVFSFVDGVCFASDKAGWQT